MTDYRDNKAMNKDTECYGSMLPIMPDGINTQDKLFEYLCAIRGFKTPDYYKDLLIEVWDNAESTQSLASDDLCERVEQALK